MSNLLVTLFVILIIVILVLMSRNYITGSSIQQRRYEYINNMQKCLEENPGIFGIKENGTSIDNRQIYPLSPDDIGV